MPKIRISTSLADGGKPRSLIISMIVAGDEETKNYQVLENEFEIEVLSLPIKYLRLVPVERGYWSYCEFDVDKDRNIRFEVLPKSGPIGWWHQIHGIDLPDLSLAQGIRIGIIDEALELQSDGSCIGHVTNLGSVPSTGEADDRAHTPKADHGEAVTSIVASRCTLPQGYQGVAPGAEVYFASAGSDSSQCLSIGRVANAIDYLAHQCECDFINISAGESEKPLPGIRAAVQDAWDVGVLCFFASGNRGSDADILYPARYSEGLSVAACGLRRFAPPHTEEQLHDLRSYQNIIGDDLYRWWGSSIRGTADFIAAGSNVIWTHSNKSAEAVNGTSFACPIAVGVAAVLCSRTREYQTSSRTARRSEIALELLKNRCIPLGQKQSGVKYGLVHV